LAPGGFSRAGATGVKRLAGCRIDRPANALFVCVAAGCVAWAVLHTGRDRLASAGLPCGGRITLLGSVAAGSVDQASDSRVRSAGQVEGSSAAAESDRRSGWVSLLREAMAHPAMAFLLLLIGFSALYCELQMPGIGAAGFVALLCLVLFFWNRFLGGTVQWLDVTLFLTGCACLLLELAVIPGFGIFGLGGVVLVVASLVLANQTFLVPTSMEQLRQLAYSAGLVFGAMLATVLLVGSIGPHLAKVPLLRHMFLVPLDRRQVAEIRRREMLVDWSNLQGQKGVTVTPLKPSGKVQFGEQLVDVVAQGEMIPPGVEVVAVEARANRVVVARADETPTDNHPDGGSACNAGDRPQRG